MLVAYYIAALLADELAADAVWDLWNAGEIGDDLASLAWWLVALQDAPKHGT